MKGFKLHTKFVLLLVGAALIPLLVSSAVTLSRFQKALETEATRLGNQLGATAASEIESFILQQLGFLDYVGVIYHPESPVQRKVADAILENVLYKSEHFVDISVVDRDGFERARKNRILVIDREDLRDFQGTAPYRAVKAQGIFVGPVYSREGRIFFDLGRKLVDGRGDFAGAVFAQVDAKVMPLVMENISRIAGPSGRVYIVDETGRVIAHPDLSYMLAERDLSSLPVVRKLVVTEGARTAETYVNETGQAVLGSAHPMVIELFDQRSRESLRVNWFVVAEQPVDSVFGAAEDAIVFAALISLAVVALAGGLAFFFAGRISRPIEALHAAALEFGKGNLSYRAAVETKDEIGALARSMNAMAETLSKSIASLKEEEAIISAERNKLSVILSGITNAVIAVDLEGKVVLFNKAAEALLGLSAEETFGKPLEGLIRLFEGEKRLSLDEYCPVGGRFSKTGLRLEAAGEERYVNAVSGNIAEGSSVDLRSILTMQDVTREFFLEKTKREFVSVAAHQLRTPLTGITWALEALAAEAKGNKVIEGGITAVRRMSGIVNGLLDVSRIEEGRFGIKLEMKPVAPLFEKISKAFQKAAEEKNIRFKMVVQNALPLLAIDEGKLELAVGNLVDNAIRYTPPGGEVAVAVALEKGELVTSISDSGIGISKEEGERLFTKFFRSPRAQAYSADGSGLGLFVAKNIIEQHSGKLWFESKENEGAKFYFSLPLPASRA